MRSKRWLVGGIVAACFAVPFMPACGSDTFTSAAPDAATNDSALDVAVPSDAADATVPVFCESKDAAIFCVDFDETDIRNAFTSGGNRGSFSRTRSSAMPALRCFETRTPNPRLTRCALKSMGATAASSSPLSPAACFPINPASRIFDSKATCASTTSVAFWARAT